LTGSRDQPANDTERGIGQKMLDLVVGHRRHFLGREQAEHQRRQDAEDEQQPERPKHQEGAIVIRLVKL
jgi:hypothetical protein